MHRLMNGPYYLLGGNELISINLPTRGNDHLIEIPYLGSTKSNIL